MNNNPSLTSTTGPRLQLKERQAHGVLKGHPWVYANELTEIPAGCEPGQSCPLVDAKGRFLGYGLVNPRSTLAWRRYSRQKTDLSLDRATLSRLLKNAILRRPSSERFTRLVWSDADSLPGLIVDRFDDVLVVQSVTAGIDHRLEIICELLCELVPNREIVVRCDAPIRTHEGVPNFVRTASGNTLPEAWYNIDGIDYWLDLENGQKTGFYLDQRLQHDRVGRLAADRRVLDVCCNQGAFALQAARHGATSVQAIDISTSCIETVHRNAAKNGLSIDASAANAFDFFSENRGACWDLIILDPPSFARNRKALAGAMKGYKELNLRAFQSLQPGGILATYGCSHHVHPEEFLAMLADAAADAHKTVQLIELTSQPPDHPILLGFPESHYLKGALLKVLE